MNNVVLHGFGLFSCSPFGLGRLGEKKTFPMAIPSGVMIRRGTGTSMKCTAKPPGLVLTTARLEERKESQSNTPLIQ